jgi:deoxyribodipyrimidine photo-lyase
MSGLTSFSASRASSAAAASDASTSTSSTGTTGIVWFKQNNLRLHDNEALHMAHAKGHSAVLHVFIFDPFWFARTSFGFLKTGHFRARFLLESLADLRANLKKQGSTLIVRTGDTPAILASLAEATKAKTVYSQGECCSEEQAVDREVHKLLKARGASLVSCWGGSTMYDLDDLPFDIRSPSGGPKAAEGAKKPFPQIYTQFRKVVESTCSLREPLSVIKFKVRC